VCSWKLKADDVFGGGEKILVVGGRWVAFVFGRLVVCVVVRFVGVCRGGDCMQTI